MRWCRCYDNRYYVVAIVTVAVLKQSLLCSRSTDSRCFNSRYKEPEPLKHTRTWKPPYETICCQLTLQYIQVTTVMYPLYTDMT